MDEDWGLGSSSSSSSDSEDEQELKKPCGLFYLPFEILSQIFILSQNTQLPIVCKHLFNQLYHCHETIKIRFLMYRCNSNIEQTFEEAVKFPFFTIEMVKRLDAMFGKTVMFTDKKLPARLFLEEPKETLPQRDNVVVALLERGASPNRPKGYPLIKSAQLGRFEQVKLLVDYGADPTVRNNMALRVCAARNNKQMVNYFLDELKVKPDSETLKTCIQKNLWEMVQVLVDHGAVPDMSTIDVA